MINSAAEAWRKYRLIANYLRRLYGADLCRYLVIQFVLLLILFVVVGDSVALAVEQLKIPLGYTVAFGLCFMYGVLGRSEQTRFATYPELYYLTRFPLSRQALWVCLLPIALLLNWPFLIMSSVRYGIFELDTLIAWLAGSLVFYISAIHLRSVRILCGVLITGSVFVINVFDFAIHASLQIAFVGILVVVVMRYFQPFRQVKSQRASRLAGLSFGKRYSVVNFYLRFLVRVEFGNLLSGYILPAMVSAYALIVVLNGNCIDQCTSRAGIAVAISGIAVQSIALNCIKMHYDDRMCVPLYAVSRNNSVVGLIALVALLALPFSVLSVWMSGIYSIPQIVLSPLLLVGLFQMLSSSFILYGSVVPVVAVLAWLLFELSPLWYASVSVVVSALCVVFYYQARRNPDYI